MSSDKYSNNYSAGGEDWQCSECGYVNWARRQSCNNLRCNAPRTRGGSRSSYGSSKYRTRRNIDDSSKQLSKKLRIYDDLQQCLDEFDVFGKSVSAQLKVLSVEEAVMAQVKIQTILAECRVNDVKKGFSAENVQSTGSNDSEKAADSKDGKNGTPKEDDSCDEEPNAESLLSEAI